MPPSTPHRTNLFERLAILASVVAHCAASQVRPNFGYALPFDLPSSLAHGRQLTGWSRDSICVLFWNAPQNTLVVGTADKAGLSWQFTSSIAPGRFDDVVIDDFDEDGRSDILLASRFERMLRCVEAGPERDTASVAWELSLTKVPERILIGDINADGRKDLLVYESNEPGLEVMLNVEPGKWRRGNPVAPDIGVRAAALTFLNNDFLPDILLYDWVHSELKTLYGVGRGRFLEQGAFPTTGIPDEILIAPGSSDEPIRFFLIERARAEISFWSMDEGGDLARRHQLPVGRVITSADIVSVSARGTVTMAVLDGAGRFSTFRFDTDRSEIESVSYGMYPRSADALLIRRPNSQPDAVVIQPSLHTAVLYRGHPDSMSLAQHVSYVAGENPSGVSVRDLNGDGFEDVAVANAGDNSLSLFWGTGSLRLSPHAQIGLPSSPAAVISGAASDSVVRFATSHTKAQGITAVEYDLRDQSIATTSIPTVGTPDLVGDEELSDTTSPLVITQRDPSGGAVVSLFSRLRHETFLEQTLRLGPPALLLGAAHDDMDGDGKRDFVMVYKPDDTTLVSAGIAFADSALEMSPRSVLQELPVSSAQRALVWTADLNVDSLRDVIVAFPRPTRSLYVLLGSRDTSLTNPILVDSTASIDGRDRLITKDVDGDGSVDLIASLPERGGVGWWKQSSEGGFEEWKLLVPARDCAGIAALSGPGNIRGALVVARREHGLVTIHNLDLFTSGADTP